MAVHGQPPLQAQPQLPSRTERESTISIDEPKICRNFVWGTCLKDTKCKFRHELVLEEMKKILKFCHDHQNKNGCTRIDCTYLHVTKEEESDFLATGKIPQVLLGRYEAIRIAANASEEGETTSQIEMFIKESYMTSQQDDEAGPIATSPVPMPLEMLTSQLAPPQPPLPSVRLTSQLAPPQPPLPSVQLTSQPAPPQTPLPSVRLTSQPAPPQPLLPSVRLTSQPAPPQPPLPSVRLTSQQPPPQPPLPPVRLTPRRSPPPPPPSVRLTQRRSPPPPPPPPPSVRLTPRLSPPSPHDVHMMPVMPLPVMPLGMPLAAKQQLPPPPPPPPPPTASTNDSRFKAPVYTAPLAPHPEITAMANFPMNQQPPSLPILLDTRKPPSTLPTQIPASSVAVKHKALNLSEAGPSKIRKSGANNAAVTLGELCPQDTIRIHAYMDDYEKLQTENEYLKLLYEKKVKEYEVARDLLRCLVSADLFQILQEWFEEQSVAMPLINIQDIAKLLQSTTFSLGHTVSRQPQPQTQLQYSIMSLLQPTSFDSGPSISSNMDFMETVSEVFRRRNVAINRPLYNTTDAADAVVIKAFLDLLQQRRV